MQRLDQWLANCYLHRGLSLMNKIKLSTVALWAIALAVAPSISGAVFPETGMYVETGQEARGKGYYIELQGDTVFLVIYAYDEETGEAEIYTAASEIRDDAVSMGFLLPDDPPFSTDGYFPLHWMTGRLFRVTDGPCLDCGGPPDGFVTEEVGDVGVWFPYTGLIRIAYTSDDQSEILETFAVKQNFGHGEILNPNKRLQLHEVMGQWLFADQTDPSRPPWRFNFDERIPEAPGPQNTISLETPFEVTYRDSTTSAEFRCQVIPPSAGGDTQDGCELHLNGEVLFSAAARDIGATRIRAFRGELAPLIFDDGPVRPEFTRGPDAVIGVRIETPPDLDGEP